MLWPLIKSPGTQLFVHRLIQDNINENMKTPYHWPLEKGIHQWPVDCSHNKANLRYLIAATGLVILHKLDSNRRLFSLCNFFLISFFMDDLEKQWGNSFILYQALCIISNSWVNSKLSHSPETLISGQKLRFLSFMTLRFDGWPWKPREHILHYFIAIGEFKLELQSENDRFGSKLALFCPVWSWNLTDDLEKQ